jgi:hypothetical protein
MTLLVALLLSLGLGPIRADTVGGGPGMRVLPDTVGGGPATVVARPADTVGGGPGMK